MFSFTRARAALVLCAAACATALAQQPPASLRALVADLTGPAIDRGIRDNDPPRPVRTSAAAGVNADAAYVRGSVIVKFRAGTSPAAQRAMLARVNGLATQGQSFADFDLVSIDA